MAATWPWVWGIVRLFDTAAGREVARLHGHDDRIHWLGFAKADAALVSTSLDGTLRIWDVATAAPRAPEDRPDRPR
jgi:WD40 repeat protein